MNEDRVTGTVKNLGGQAEAGLGRATGDIKSQVQGTVKQAEGTLQDFYGQAKDAAVNTAQAVRESAMDADDVVRTAIERRPYTAAAIALCVGFLIGRFAHRRDY
jgi:uncharacterized protein YjbJ (UPF0337 family)